MSYNPKAVISGVKGRIEGVSDNGAIINNIGGKIDIAYFENVDSLLSTAYIRVEHSMLPKFWVEIPLDLKQLKYLLDEDEKRLKEERDSPKSIPMLKSTCTPYNCKCNAKECQTYK